MALAAATAAASGPIDILYLESAAVSHSRADAVPPFTPMIIRIADEQAVEQLEAMGVRILHRRDELLLTYVPTEYASEIDGITDVRRTAVARRNRPFLDVARRATHTDDVTAGNVPGSGSFDGSGVTVGFADAGFDPGHAIFRDHLAMVAQFDEPNGIAEIHTDGLTTLPTDNSGLYHATHVGGILGGGKSGDTYRGVATGAAMAATTSSLYDVGILAGVEEIISLARQRGEPAVINLSLGTSLGPHDGTDLFTTYLDRCAEDAVIVMSAGNDGGGGVSLSRTFTAGHTAAAITPASTADWDYREIHGYCDGWSADSRPFDVSLCIYDMDTRSIVFRSEPCGAISGNERLSLSSENNPDFGACFSGNADAAWEVNPDNGRYNLTVSLDYSCHASAAGTGWTRYYGILTIEAREGTTVDFCADGDNIFFRNIGTVTPDITDPDNTLSISSMACGSNTVCVGSATTRDSTPLLSGGSTSWAGHVTAGKVSGFSSWGRLRDGRSLPHFCAPGAYVVSGVSRHFLEANPSELAKVCAEVPDAPGHYYIAECGTSMASPHAAGIFALWLQADPSLSASDLLDIATTTAQRDYPDIADPRYGAGMIDARAGLAEVLRRAGVAAPDAVVEPLARRAGGSLEVDDPSGTVVSVEVTDIAGRRVDPRNLPTSPVIVRLTTDSGIHVYKL